MNSHTSTNEAWSSKRTWVYHKFYLIVISFVNAFKYGNVRSIEVMLEHTLNQVRHYTD
jgi:hypothetical protein